MPRGESCGGKNILNYDWLMKAKKRNPVAVDPFNALLRKDFEWL